MKNSMGLIVVTTVFVVSLASGMHEADPLATSQCESDLRQRVLRNDEEIEKLEDINVYSFANNASNVQNNAQQMVAAQSWTQYGKMQCKSCVGLTCTLVLLALTSPKVLACFFGDQCNL